jgi:hypothetical protein
MIIIGPFLDGKSWWIFGEMIFLRIGHGGWFFWSLSANFHCSSKANKRKRGIGV